VALFAAPVAAALPAGAFVAEPVTTVALNAAPVADALPARGLTRAVAPDAVPVADALPALAFVPVAGVK
jgi:hypothetical protein